MVLPAALREYRDWAKEKPHVEIRLNLLILALVLLTIMGWYSFQYKAGTEIPLAGAVRLHPDGHGGSWVIIRYKARLSDQCVAQGVHTSFMDGKAPEAVAITEGSTPRDYFPLAASLRGPGLGESVPAFNLWLHLPPGVPIGTLSIINRVEFSCPPMGLSTGRQTSRPIVVNVTPDGVTLPPGQWFDKDIPAP